MPVVMLEGATAYIIHWSSLTKICTGRIRTVPTAWAAAIRVGPPSITPTYYLERLLRHCVGLPQDQPPRIRSALKASGAHFGIRIHFVPPRNGKLGNTTALDESVRALNGSIRLPTTKRLDRFLISLVAGETIAHSRKPRSACGRYFRHTVTGIALPLLAGFAVGVAIVVPASPMSLERAAQSSTPWLLADIIIQRGEEAAQPEPPAVEPAKPAMAKPEPAIREPAGPVHAKPEHPAAPAEPVRKKYTASKQAGPRKAPTSARQKAVDAERPPAANSERCQELLLRSSLGEELPAAEQEMLTTQCK